MARFALLLALCMVLVALATARYVGNPFLVTGRVYCDTCRAGYETDATKPISGARVKVECIDRDTYAVKYAVTGVTDSNGTYNILVTGDRENDICDCKLVSSPQSDCAEQDPARSSSRLCLTRNNGLVSDTRNANAMGFLRSEPMSGCTQILKKYQETDI